jgi:hypothetical protein
MARGSPREIETIGERQFTGRSPQLIGGLFGRVQFERSRVDTVAESGRLRAVLKYMAEMRVAAITYHLKPNHAQTDVLDGRNVVAFD